MDRGGERFMFGIHLGDNIYGYSVIGLYMQQQATYVLAYAPGKDMPYATWKVCGHGLFLDCRPFPDLAAAAFYLCAQLFGEKESG